MARRKYIYDIKTSNLSFLQTSADLKKLGIKNCMFFLALYDISLVGVDPYSNKLSNDQIYRIITECMINPWYYLREVCRIPDPGNVKGIPYILHRANLAMTWCALNSIDSYITIARQMGKTQSAIALILWVFLFGTTNSEFMFANKKYEDAVNNLRRLKDQRDLLPQYLQYKLSINDEGKVSNNAIDNVKTVVNHNMGNRIVTKPSATSVASAEGIGRGNSQTIQYLDEVEFADHIKTIMEAAGPAFLKSSENAKKNGSTTFRLLSSTPGDLDSRPGEQAQSILDNTCTWSEKFYDMSIDMVRDYVATNSRNGIVYIEYNYKQLGRDDNWFNAMCRVLEQNPIKIKRELLLQRMHGSSLSPFDAEDLESIAELKKPIIEERFISSIFKLNIYYKLDPHRIYFIGVDVATGGSGDNTAITVWDPYERKPVAEFSSPHIGIVQLNQFIVLLVRKHIPKSIIIVERNHVGEGVLDSLRSTEVSNNLYWNNSKDLDIDEKLDKAGFIERQSKRRKLYGVYTQKKSRDLMYDLLARYVAEDKDKFVTENITRDLMNLVRMKSGKIAAAEGKHDDSIMSFLLCLYVYYYGANLSRYGFIKGKLPDENDIEKEQEYQQIEELLNENEKKFFSNVNATSLIDNTEETIIDPRAIYEKNKANMNEFNHKEKETPKITVKRSIYDENIRKEQEKQIAELQRFYSSHNFTNIAKPADGEIDTNFTNIDSSFFDELNK